MTHSIRYILKGEPMNLRNVESYQIGLDIGTGSVGWVVLDGEGDLCRFKGKPTWEAGSFRRQIPLRMRAFIAVSAVATIDGGNDSICCRLSSLRKWLKWTLNFSSV